MNGVLGHNVHCKAILGQGQPGLILISDCVCKGEVDKPFCLSTVEDEMNELCFRP